MHKQDSAMSLPKRGAAANRTAGEEPLPDLTDFMNDWFFGSANLNRQAYNLSGSGSANEEEEEEASTWSGAKKKTSSGRLTQEWVEEAKKIAAGSPTRPPRSPARSFGSPRFATAEQDRESSPMLDRRDPLSRSARRHKSSLEGISDEILRRSSARHNRTASSDSFLLPGHPPEQPSSEGPLALLPPKLPVRRTSRFRQDPPAPLESQSPGATYLKSVRIRPHSPSSVDDTSLRQPLLSPPRNLVESAHRRSVSSTTCSVEYLSRSDREKGYGHRRAISSSPDSGDLQAEAPSPEDVRQINEFLTRQRKMIGRISRGEVSAKAKIILSGSANSTTSSMAAAICYAWLLGNREEEEMVVVPVVNIESGRMNKHKQAAWLFYHVGIDASVLLFADEVDLENLLMARQLSILVIGQDVLKTNNEVGSICTVLTDNYCEEAYDLLQNPNLKKLLLAGILLDTNNLNDTAQFVTKRDAEAVRLLSAGSSSSYRYEFFEQLMQEDHKDNLFLEALKNYGKPAPETKEKPPPTPAPVPAPAPVKAREANPRGKNKFFLAKWFGFGSK